jgi:hypothetical protein
VLGKREHGASMAAVSDLAGGDLQVVLGHTSERDVLRIEKDDRRLPHPPSEGCPLRVVKGGRECQALCAKYRSGACVSVGRLRQLRGINNFAHLLAAGERLDNALQLRHEGGLQQLVGLVQHQHAYALDIERALGDECGEPAAHDW